MADKDLLIQIEYEDFSFESASSRFLKRYVLDIEKAFENFNFNSAPKKLQANLLRNIKATENIVFLKAEHKKLKTFFLSTSSANEAIRFTKSEYRRLKVDFLNTKKAVEEFDAKINYVEPRSTRLVSLDAYEIFSCTADYRVTIAYALRSNKSYENFDAFIYEHKLFHYLLDTKSVIEDFFVTALGRISSHKLISKNNIEDVEINIIAPGYDILGQCVLKKCNLKPGETIVIDSDEYVVLKNAVSIESPKWNLGTASLSNGTINSTNHRGCYTDFIKVTAGEKIYHTETKMDNIRYQYSLFYTNDNDASYVSGSSITLKDNGFFTVPKNAEYMVIGLYKTEGYSFDNDYTNADIQFWRKGDELYKEAVYMQSGDWIDELDQNISLLGIQDVVGSNGLSISIEYTERFY